MSVIYPDRPAYLDLGYLFTAGPGIGPLRHIESLEDEISNNPGNTASIQGARDGARPKELAPGGPEHAYPRGLAGTITRTAGAITVTLHQPGIPRVTRALDLLIEEISSNPPAMPGDPAPSSTGSPAGPHNAKPAYGTFRRSGAIAPRGRYMHGDLPFRPRRASDQRARQHRAACHPVQAGQGVCWAAGEVHTSGTDTSLTALAVEGSSLRLFEPEHS
jgi:hypothetical protein